MKPVAFAYEAPNSVDEALALLAQHGPDAKVLAGGQSLVPMLNFRLVRPEVLVDINRLAELSALNVTDGTLQIGAIVRTAALEQTPAVAAGWPLLREAAGLVGHRVIRNRGTVGGSVAHADPHAELPVVLTALNGRFHVRSQRGDRDLTADEFFRDYYTTNIEPDELLVGIEVPAVPARTGAAFVEHARTHGDFAVAGAAAVLTFDPGGRCTRASLVVLGGAGAPVRASAAEGLLAGETVTERLAQTAGKAAADACDPEEPVDYRRALIAEMVRRALVTAARRSMP